jgi:hypothetical protein
MTLFGRREEDPLLQNDPLAPSSDDGQEGPRSSNENDSSEAVPPENEDVSPDGPDEDASSVASPRSETPESVFGAGSSTDTNNHFSFDGTDETRVIIRTAEEATSGRLTVLNSAFDQGWRVDRIEVNPGAPRDTPPEGQDAASNSPSRSFAFVLRRPE